MASTPPCDALPSSLTEGWAALPNARDPAALPSQAMTDLTWKGMAKRHIALIGEHRVLVKLYQKAREALPAAEAVYQDVLAQHPERCGGQGAVDGGRG